MIAINWGSSNFRACKLDAAGNVEAERSSGRGAALVQPGSFLDALTAEVGDWVQEGEARILMSGMVGARNGWKEAPYIPLPAAFDQVVDGVIRIELNSLDARIVPGLIAADPSGVPEVLRGEEAEIFGCQSELAGYSHLCLPGTHTKWVRMEAAKIVAFSTSMTGDLYKAIRENTILRACANRSQPMAMRSCSAWRAQSKRERFFTTSSASGRWFSPVVCRSLGIVLPVGAHHRYDVKASARAGERVHLIGDLALCSHYARALGEFNVDSSLEPTGAALRGLVRIARSLKW